MGRSKDINREELLKELEGKVFNGWTVVSWDDSKRKRYLICRCEYNELHSVEYWSMVNGRSRGCWCRKTKDLIGKKFGRLTVLYATDGPETNKKKYSYWMCECDCPDKTKKPIRRAELLGGVTISCGCYRIEKVTKHGKYRTGEYNSWANMILRMTNPNDPHYPDYAGRGLTIDEFYLDFNNFLADLGPKPSPQHSIGRKLNDLGYVRGNLRWETSTEQANNRRSSSYLTFNGKTQTIAQWSKETGIDQKIIRHRIKVSNKWSIEDALTILPTPKPQKNVRPHSYQAKKSDDPISS